MLSAKNLASVALVGADSTGHADGGEPDHANRDSDMCFISKGTSDASWWGSLRGGITDPVACIVVHPDLRKTAVPHGLCGVIAEVMSDSTRVAWASPVMIHTSEEPLHIYVPAVVGRRIRLRKCKDNGKGKLSFRKVETYLQKAAKYHLSKNILTIDKYSVAQPFSLAELAHSTAYGNLLTTSACCELSTQESMQEEREQEALNLTHHLAGIWNGETFTHGQHVSTTRIVLLSILENVKNIFMEEARLVDVPAPCYVFGDIHGNFQDLIYFMSNLVPFKHVKYSSHNYLFLGDYVDRGAWDVECFAYLMAMKIQAPNKVFLLRGNHEDRRQNAKLEESFFKHCCLLFGDEGGHEVWEKANDVFDVMPLCAVVDGQLFASHGGVPRVPVDEATGQQMCIRKAMAKVPCPLKSVANSSDPYLQMACDLLWADPADDKYVETFAKNEVRGCACVFGMKAVEDFLSTNKFQSIFRAHQCFSFGVNICKSAKVITVFTSSNYCDNQSCAGCALLTVDHRILLLMKEHTPQSPK
eukprot:TRINITY_DN7183_c0_g1_i1.p1 TRINITY_DN7183_c0_g1~~TRINITY_DN7183_c0_g1_i1.p1  ORF type:complete len:554 (+),score=225.84 TRINITY_DN7183_c0_g1_i1:81-1664(+)